LRSSCTLVRTPATVIFDMMLAVFQENNLLVRNCAWRVKEEVASGRF
jgi:hypothetical protein